MGIQYDGLFAILKDKGISKTQLQKKLGLSSTTLAKLSKNESVSMKVVEAICKELNCQPGDIMKLENETTAHKLLKTLQEEKGMKLKGGLYHLTQIKLAYNSNRIEGSKLTEDQTRYIYETNTIGMEKDKTTNVDDIIETINHFQCFDYMLDCAEDSLSETIIKNFHKVLKNNTTDSRKEWFRVGDYKVKPEMAKLLFDYNAKDGIGLADIIEFHYDFEAIHPFQDGNGRVGRVIIFKECLKYGIPPFIIDNEHKQFYYRGLKEYKNEKGYLTETCLSAQDEYLGIMKYFSIS
ncbi:MAG TPA: helix-turn-helix domain-containing protein [Anaerovoracaceae bacterium]|nr:helix-turn-helix domain-containing protein [Anaerovoracaceae bacterium]